MIQKLIKMYSSFISQAFTNTVNYSFDSVIFANKTFTKKFVSSSVDREFTLRIRKPLAPFFFNKRHVVSFLIDNDDSFTIKQTYENYSKFVTAILFPVLALLLAYQAIFVNLLKGLLGLGIILILTPILKHVVNIVEWPSIEKVLISYLNSGNWQEDVELD